MDYDTISEEEYNRARWASRRGMLELDLVLEPFVRERYRRLGAEDRRRYQMLLRSEDQDLFAWFLHRKQPDDHELRAIVEQIITFTRRGGES